MNRFVSVVVFCCFCVFLTIFAGCSFDGKNPAAPDGLANLPTDKVSVSMVIDTSSSGKFADIRAAAGTPASVTFCLKTLNFGSATMPVTIQEKTVSATTSGTAEVVFDNVPAVTTIGEIHIAGGSIASQTDFHGALDLQMNTSNMIYVSAVGGKKSSDIIAETILRIIASPTIFMNANNGLAAQISNIIPNLSTGSQTIYEDALAIYLGGNPYSGKTINSFVFSSLSPAATGIIDENARTITVKVASGATLNTLTPTINFTGASVSPASGEAVKFTAGVPATYTVTSTDNSTKYYQVTVWESLESLPENAWMNIPEGKIYSVSPDMEYTLDNGNSWIPCSSSSSVVVASFSVGNIVWVRKTGNDSSKIKLGQVNSLTGGDLIASNRLHVGKLESGNIWYDFFSGSPNEQMKLYYYFRNIGTASCYNANHKIRFYISTDRKIDAASDALLAEISYAYSCPVGDIPANYIDFAVPATLTAGVYYIGAIVDATGQVTEMNDDNNYTLPANTLEFRIKDTTSSQVGAFKFVNSWGKSGTWERKSPYDGHYWITYAVMKKQELAINYYYNNFAQQYRPTVIAVFKPVHSKRNECLITLGLGVATAPVISKELQSRFSTTLLSGSYAFPDEVIAFDISEFATQLNDYNLFLNVENSGSTAGTIATFSIEFYDYNQNIFKVISGSTGTFGGNASTSFVVPTKSALSSNDLRMIAPLPRNSLNDTFVEELPGSEELSEDMNSVGVAEPGRNYNAVVAGEFGTGYRPPSVEQWQNMRKLRDFSSGKLSGALPESMDNSATNYFPPIGHQGTKGSCTTWATAYYIHTYNEAREHNWDLSGTTWDSVNNRPSANLDKIFSPDFVYHQINSGYDSGSDHTDAISLLTRIGGASWNRMPVDRTNYTSWPTEAAWREAAKFRGREVNIGKYNNAGYFIIKTDDDINLLKSLISAGYCVTTSIKSGQLTDSEANIFKMMTTNDVAADANAAKMIPDHAQTIVGYKNGDFTSASPD
ncbi:MAG: hypothetical protein HQM10_25850 [Candidatus Riflebacteria bacterium]|nr:hypothetical protein [Candidatus Riflebacteria bacterium]